MSFSIRWLCFVGLMCTAVYCSSSSSASGSNSAASTTAGKRVYRVGGWLPGTADEITPKLKPLLENYLTTYFQTNLNSSAAFKFIPVDYSEESYANTMIEANKLDFLYTLAGRAVCVEAEFGWIPVATQRADVLGIQTGAQGSIVFSLKSNTKIRNVTDFKHASIGIGYLLSSNSYHFGYQLLSDNGVDLFIDVPKVVVYDNDYMAMLTDVVKEKLDAGVLPSTWMIQNAQDILNSELLVHNPTVHTYEGEDYPFPSSTALAPQYGVMASPDVPWDVKSQVADALTNLTQTDPAAIAASAATFTMPGHYADVEDALNALGMMVQPSLQSWTEGTVSPKCHSPFEDILDTIKCPKGYVLQDAETIAFKCRKNGQECPTDRPCLCRPCQRDLKVKVFPAKVVLGLVMALFSLTLMLSVCWVVPIQTAPYAADLARRAQRFARPIMARFTRKHRPRTQSSSV